ncbi:SHOCT domain-containing protein [Chitinimonas koreensis]|uniref:SHOCT domain-containing protein n=1 Tax=Chitinimonas koreensis TaxID=356302 RepID=UPI00040F3B0E|nr:SHOCT domain-containing protein [Chitinimonas koreensis]
MQHALSSHFGRFALGLLLMAGAQADSSKPWSETDDYVKLDAVNAGNAHPVTFSTDQLQNLLARFYKQAPGKQPEPYFSDDEIKRLSTDLVPYFGRAQAGDDVLFGTSYRPGGMFFMPRVLNAGRLFVEGGRLNLLAGMCGDQPDLSYQYGGAKGRPLNHGSRIKPVNGMGCQLLAGNGTVRVNNRPDWLSLDIPQALAAKPPGAFQPAEGSAPATTFQPAAKPATTFQPATQPAAPAPAAAPASAAPVAAPAAAAPAVLPSAPASKIEEKLVLLKRMFDSGLITEDEYRAKRAQLLKDF